MAHLPLAFSVHHFISSVGADAGFASIIGLAILVLLYFAQARETATLRGRADEAEQRAGQLEARLVQLARQPQVPAPRAAPGPVARPLANSAARAGAARPAPAAATAAAIPSAPAGVGAPPLSAATRLIPMPVGAPVPSETPVPPRPVPAVVGTPAPITAAGSASASAVGAAADGNTGGNGFAQDTSVAPVALAPEPPSEPLPRVQLRPGGAQSRPAPPPLRRSAGSRPPSSFGRWLALALAALGVAVVVVVLLIATGGGSSSKSTSLAGTKTSNAPSAHHRTKPKGLDKAAVTVTVLNGTAASGLAAKILGQLGGDGFKQGTATNAANQTQSTTTVEYLPGQRAAAVAVAKALKLSNSAVAQIDSGTQAIACPQSASCTVDVVVTVGQDLASQ